MEWVIIAIVPILIIAWRYLWSRSEPPKRHEMTDVRGALADRLQGLASDALAENRHREAQQLEYQALWLRTRPTDVGGDAPPEELVAANERHVRFAGSVWEKYATFLAERDEAQGESTSGYASALPFTSEDIAAALRLLIDVGEGRTQCAFIDVRSIPSEAVEAMKKALDRLKKLQEDPA